MMRREFHLVYKPKAGPEVGEPIAKTVVAERQAQAETAFGNVEIVSIWQTRILLDPHQNIFNKEEAAEYLRCKADKIEELMGQGKLPRAREGFPKFTKRMLDQVIEDQMTQIEKAA